MFSVRTILSFGKQHLECCMKQLDLEKGEVDLEGKVDSLTYLSKNTDNRDESLFRRMFR